MNVGNFSGQRMSGLTRMAWGVRSTEFKALWKHLLPILHVVKQLAEDFVGRESKARRAEIRGQLYRLNNGDSTHL